MFSTCPRCDSSMLDSCGNCSSCGYTLRIPCNECGFKNIPLGKYCGKCGEGLTFKVRFHSRINQNLSYLFRLKIKKFAAGIAFGSLLGIFAFGSMGMHSDSKIPTKSIISTYQNSFLQNENHVSGAIDELTTFRNSRVQEKFANFNDLRRFAEILQKKLGSVTKLDSMMGEEEKSPDYYINKIRNFSKKGDLNKGSAAILLYNLASDILDLSYKDFDEESRFKDIPRFHFLSIPVGALSSLGINMERDSENFGISDNVTVEQLFQAGLGLAYATEVRLKQRVFYTLQPR